MVRTIIRLAHDLGLRAVAEGIETKDDCELLREWKCDEGQGFYLARPVPPEGVTELLRADACADGGEGAAPRYHNVVQLHAS